MADPNENQRDDTSEDWAAEEPPEEEGKRPPPPEVKTYDGPAYYQDPAFFRAVVNFGGWVLILAVGIMGLLAANDKTIPEGVVAVASGLVGLLTGTFAAKASNRSG